MKLLALRAAAFRRFVDGVAVEGFAPGVNLLAGPNEFGKSTLFQALEAAFLVKHTSTGSAVEGLRPRGGGDPLVEVDFEANGRRWRIRKQFGRGRGAVLSDLDAGRTLARALEAEEQLAVLTGARADGPGRFGLMWVRQQRALLAPDPDVEPDTGRSKVRGEANALVELLNAEVIEAAGSGQAEQILKRVRADLDALVTSRGARAGSVYAKALQRCEEARAALDRARAVTAASEERLARIAKGTQMLADVEDPAAAAALGARITTLERALTEAGAVRERHNALLDQIKARELEAKEAQRTLNELVLGTTQLSEMTSRLARARDLHADVEARVVALERNGATPATLAELEGALSALTREVAAIAEMSTAVEIEPVAGAAVKIKADGQPVEQATRLAVPERLTLTVAGVGTIRVTSSDAQRAAAALRRRDELEGRIAKLFAEIGAPDITEARTRVQEREAAQRALDAARRELSSLAPQGLEALAQEHHRLSATLASLDRDALERRAQECEVALLAARNAWSSAEASAPDAARVGQMEADLAEARRDLAKRREDARRFSDALARLQGEQAMADEQAGGDVASAQAVLLNAEEDVRVCEADVAALRLLNETLSALLEDVRTRYLVPVSRALLPYLARVFPGAAADFRDGFSLQALRRAGEAEDFTTLSDGTREQLSVLVRLGFAKLFAERGAPVPVVLDDPLVYSDDRRLAAMCGALEAAGTAHQVVVLTCRETAFSSLQGHRLAVTPWRDTVV